MDFGYITIGYNDIAATKKFYDAVFGEMGSKQTFDRDGRFGYATGNSITVMFVPPFNKQPAVAGNGIMPAFKCDNEAQVDAAHKAGLANGGKDEGAPGKRMPTFYGAYLRDPTGNKIAVFCRPAG